MLSLAEVWIVSWIAGRNRWATVAIVPWWMPQNIFTTVLKSEVPEWTPLFMHCKCYLGIASTWSTMCSLAQLIVWCLQVIHIHMFCPHVHLRSNSDSDPQAREFLKKNHPTPMQQLVLRTHGANDKLGFDQVEGKHLWSGLTVVERGQGGIGLKDLPQ